MFTISTNVSFLKVSPDIAKVNSANSLTLRENRLLLGLGIGLLGLVLGRPDFRPVLLLVVTWNPLGPSEEQKQAYNSITHEA